MTTPRISVVLTTHNYGKFVTGAIRSVLDQSLQDFELLIVDDGSTDYTARLLNEYVSDDRVNLIQLDGVGLPKACNHAIAMAKGEYIIRLDADDYFHEDILLIESNALDQNPEIHLVYCDYFRVDVAGELIDYYRLMSQDEMKLLDRSPLAAGAMYRKWCFEQVGGYNEEIDFQEDYDFWLKFVSQFNVKHVSLPLYSYRKHQVSMSTNTNPRSQARRLVKQQMAKQRHPIYPSVVGLIPASTSFRRGEEHKLPLEPIAGTPLIEYAIGALTGCEHIQTTYVSTNDAEIEQLALARGVDSLGCRPKDSSQAMASVVHVVKDFLLRLSHNRIELPELIVTLTPNYPLISTMYVEEAIDTLLLHDYESVISVIGDDARHWRPGAMGLTAVGDGHAMVRHDKDTVYEETGGIRVIRVRNLLGQEWLGHSIGYVELSPSDAIAADGDEALLVVLERLLQARSQQTRSRES